MKRNTKVLIIFVILLLAAMIPFKFTNSPEPYLFGWLPLPLFYYWLLVVLNFIFLLWVCLSWLKEVRQREDKK